MALIGKWKVFNRDYLGFLAVLIRILGKGLGCYWEVEVASKIKDFYWMRVEWDEGWS